MHHLSIILQMHCALQDHVASGIRARDRLTVGIVAEMLAMEVLLKVAASRECLQAISGRQVFVPEAKDALGGFTFNRERFRQTRR